MTLNLKKLICAGLSNLYMTKRAVHLKLSGFLMALSNRHLNVANSCWKKARASQNLELNFLRNGLGG